ncbi:transcriptional regulator GcvA [Telmatospirillum sp. J64-1]|uniref:transcriptional regulator GcvA n=1 Tax=Telmatospirillum sp. J64-1 TaxID=2502183 RepID=UPI00115F3BDE|nr:transcriptional regulator GcvA [Telmatospirillum sp. J64-1]
MPLRRLPPLNALRIFESAGRHESFAKAAEELHLTPSAISHQIRTLEEHLGVALFQRGRRGLTLTEAGRAYLRTVRSAFQQIAEATLKLQGESEIETLTLGAVTSFANVWLAPRLGSFVKSHPSIDLRVTSQVRPADFDHGLDAAILYGAGDWPALQADELLRVSIAPLCSPALLKGEHPLEKPEDLRFHTLIHNDNKLLSWSAWLQANGVDGVASHRGPRFDRSTLALDAAAQGLGVALDDTDLLARSYLESGRLVAPFGPGARSEAGAYWLVYPATTATRPAFTALRNWLLAEARGSALA